MDREWMADAGERVGWTFAQAAIAAGGSEALAVGIVDADGSVLRGALVGGLAAVLSAVKTIAAKRVGNPHDASTRRTLPPRDEQGRFTNDEPR